MPGYDVKRFSSVPAPTYLVGIDEEKEVAYVLAILEGMKSTIPSLPTAFPLDRANLRTLYQEVRQFWAERDMKRRKSAFSV